VKVEGISLVINRIRKMGAGELGMELHTVLVWGGVDASMSTEI